MARTEFYSTTATYKARRNMTHPKTGVAMRQGEELSREGFTEHEYKRLFDKRVICAHTYVMGDAPAPSPAAGAPGPAASGGPAEAGGPAIDAATRAAIEAAGGSVVDPQAATPPPPPSPEELAKRALSDSVGFIEHTARGWYNVYFRDKDGAPVAKMRGEEKARAELDRLRAEAGVVVEGEPKEPAPEAPAAPQVPAVLPTDDAALHHTGGETTEIPDEETPSAPFTPPAEWSGRDIQGEVDDITQSGGRPFAGMAALDDDAGVPPRPLGEAA